MSEQEKYDWIVCVRSLTYNHAPYIEEAMNGFTMQETNFPFVCAVVDDASTDGEQEVIKNYLNEHFDLEDKKIVRHEETDDYVLTFARHKTNLNCYFAVYFLKYNHYNKKAKGPYLARWSEKAKYIAVCEGDDYWIDSHKLQKQFDFMESHLEYSMCFTDVKDYHQAKGAFGKSVLTNYDNTKLPIEKKDLFYYILLGKCRIQTVTVLYRNSSFREIKMNDKSFLMGDTTKWLDLSQMGSLFFLPDITGVYRIAIGSVSRNPQTQLRFRLSMFEMRVYYCKKYGYEIPKEIKRDYNRSLVDIVINTDFNEADALYPLFPMNFCQSLLFHISKKNKVIGKMIDLIWHIEFKLH